MKLSMCMVALVLLGQQAFGASVVEEHDRLKVNWSTLKISFYGEAEPSKDDESFKAVEKAAWREGLEYASEAVRNLHVALHEKSVTDLDRLSQNANTAAQNISKATYSRNTTYFGNGRVRVDLESQLPKALFAKGLRFRQKEALEPARSHYSGILFQLSRRMKPTPVYKIYDQEGMMLFSEQDMAEDAYKENLMGRWFITPKGNELQKAIGAHPIKIKVKVDAEGRFIVDRKTWLSSFEGHKSLLVTGKIALGMPK